MSLHTDLAIYKAAMKLTTMSSRLVSNMDRNYRSVDGARLVSHSREILKHIRHANQADDKVPHIDALLDEVVDLQVDLRVCVDLRQISQARYADAVELASSVERQAGGWRKYSASKPASRPSRRS